MAITYSEMAGWSDWISNFTLSPTMAATDVIETLDGALALTGVQSVRVRHCPRLLSDNGPAYVSKDLRDYRDAQDMTHTRGRPYHPQTQGKIERYHRSTKNVVKLEHYHFRWELEAAVRDFVDYYNNRRYHESGDRVCDGARINRAASKVIQEHAAEKTFLYLHYTDAHYPYAHARKLPRVFREGPGRVVYANGPIDGVSADNLAYAIDAYEDDVLYTDSLIGELGPNPRPRYTSGRGGRIL